MLDLLYFAFTGTISILGTLGRHERENRVREFRLQIPLDQGDRLWAGIVGSIGYDDLARQRLSPGGDPDLPVDIALAERVMVTEIVSDEVLAGIHRRFDLVERRSRGTPEEEIRQWHFHAVLLSNLSISSPFVPANSTDE